MAKKAREIVAPTKMRTAGNVPGGSGTYGTIIERNGDTSVIRIDLQSVDRAERMMPVDCGRAFVRNGSPHLLLAQLDPFHDARVSRALLVRYERRRFKERAETNELFRNEVERLLGADRGEVGTWVRQLRVAEEASHGRDVPSALIDADLESMAMSAGRGAILFLTTSALEQHRAAQTGSPKIWFNADLEVSLSGSALADLLVSWKEVAETL